MLHSVSSTGILLLLLDSVSSTGRLLLFPLFPLVRPVDFYFFSDSVSSTGRLLLFLNFRRTNVSNSLLPLEHDHTSLYFMPFAQPYYMESSSLLTECSSQTAVLVAVIV
jgi:hypothetical protein